MYIYIYIYDLHISFIWYLIFLSIHHHTVFFNVHWLLFCIRYTVYHVYLWFVDVRLRAGEEQHAGDRRWEQLKELFV